MAENRKEELPLPEAVTHILEECRMVLPGIQALFGFQLIAVINSAFDEKLSENQQLYHLAAIGLVALAVALVMGPAAYHRQTGPQQVTQRFILVASRLLLSSMIPLMLAISLEFYIIASLILEDEVWSMTLSFLLLAFFTAIWFVLPHWNMRRRGP